MLKYKIGDIVKVKTGATEDSKKLNGQIGTIVEVKRSHSGYQEWYYLLDIEQAQFGEDSSGIWQSELQLVKSLKKEVKIFGIVTFCKEYYK